MAHVIEIVESKTLSDGAIAVCVECCGDPTTRSWHTLYEVTALSDGEIDAAIEKHKSNVTARHEGRMKAEGYIALKINKPKEAL